MAGWALFVALAVAAGAGLWRLGFAPALRNFALAAIALGAAGYAWQGRPAQAGTRTNAAVRDLSLPPDMIAMRSALLGRYGPVARYLIPSDAMLRFGAPGAAARMVQGGINDSPGDFALWTQLGIVIARRDRGLSPAASFAFARGAALAPREPGPWYFRGVAAVEGGTLREARTAWARALALTDPRANYRLSLAGRLALLDALLEQRPAGR